MDKIHVLGISGSLRNDSYNSALLRAAQNLAPDHMQIDIYDGIGKLPLYNQDMESHELPQEVIDFKKHLLQADAVLFATPEYNYSIPGVLKNAIDWASRPYGEGAWQGKPAAIMGATMGNMGTARAQGHLRDILLCVDTYVMHRPEMLVGGAHEKIDAQGNLIDQDTITHMQNFLVSFQQHIQLYQ